MANRLLEFLIILSVSSTNTLAKFTEDPGSYVAKIITFTWDIFDGDSTIIIYFNTFILIDYDYIDNLTKEMGAYENSN